MHETEPQPLGQYLIRRLHALGVRHVFGLPGDYVLGLYRLVEQSPIAVIGTTSELCAGYAADAYARLNGLGVALVTYAVGGLSLTNAIGCAYAERSPVVVISGAAGVRERKRAQKRGESLHHTIAGYDAQRDVFAQITCAQAVLDDPATAFQEVDRVLVACLRHKRPVYLEIPRDRLDLLPSTAAAPVVQQSASDPHALAEAVAEAVAFLRASRKAILIAGIEAMRLRLQQELLSLAEANRLPMTALLLSKSAVPGRHPLFCGLYQAAYGFPEVVRFVEDSDCLLMLGTLLTNLDTGVFSHNLHEERIILAANGEVRVRDRCYPNVRLDDFVRGLAAQPLGKYDRELPPQDNADLAWRPQPGAAVTVRRLVQKLNACLDARTVVLADPGETLLAAGDLRLPAQAEFHAPAFYATLGWAVPASVGAQLACPDCRPLVLVGDGAFQMTGTELATAMRHGLNPIVIVLNNQGYLSERFLGEGKFNEIPDWSYHRLPAYLGGGRGYDVRTEEELDTALTEALAERSTYSVLNVHVDRDDQSPALRRLAAVLARRR